MGACGGKDWNAVKFCVDVQMGGLWSVVLFNERHMDMEYAIAQYAKLLNMRNATVALSRELTVKEYLKFRPDLWEPIFRLREKVRSLRAEMEFELSHDEFIPTVPIEHSFLSKMLRLYVLLGGLYREVLTTAHELSSTN